MGCPAVMMWVSEWMALFLEFQTQYCGFSQRLRVLPLVGLGFRIFAIRLLRN
jgi:hypothetical protein